MVFFLLFLILAYGVAITLFWFYQEKFIFYPTKLSPNYKFSEFENAEEVFLAVSVDIQLHALHFKVPDSKGVIFYFHKSKCHMVASVFRERCINSIILQ